MLPLGFKNAPFGPVDPDSVHNFAAAAGSYAADLTSGTTAERPRYLELNSSVLGFLSMGTTNAAVPTSNMTSGSSGFEQFGPGAPLRREIPGNSTGYSLALATSGYVSVSFWKQ